MKEVRNKIHENLDRLLMQEVSENRPSLDKIASLIDQGANLNTTDHDGYNCLMLATKTGKTDVMRLLIEKGAEVDWESDKSSRSSLALAVRGGGGFEAVKILIEAGADVNLHRSVYSETYIAAAKGYSDILQLLVEAGGQFDRIESASHITPLYAAAQNGHIRVVNYLLALGADARKVCRDGHTPLDAAKMKGHSACVAAIEYWLLKSPDAAPSPHPIKARRRL